MVNHIVVLTLLLVSDQSSSAAVRVQNYMCLPVSLAVMIFAIVVNTERHNHAQMARRQKAFDRLYAPTINSAS